MTSRGRELPGHFNPILVAELFRIQARNWDKLLQRTSKPLTDRCTNFCRDLLRRICSPDIAKGSLADIVQRALDSQASAARRELGKLRADQPGTPTTYNHYYTMTIQKKRKRKRGQSDGEMPASKRASALTTEATPGSGAHSAQDFGTPAPRARHVGSWDGLVALTPLLLVHLLFSASKGVHSQRRPLHAPMA